MVYPYPRLNQCQTLYYAMCRQLKIKANKIWATHTFGNLYLIESGLYGIREEEEAHCGWCAKTDVIAKKNFGY